MPRKRFEEQPYDPIGADIVRDAATIGQRIKAVVDGAALQNSQLSNEASGLNQSSRHKRELSARMGSIKPKSEVAKRFTLTREEDNDLTEFLQRLQKQSGTKVALSLLVRAGLNLMMQAEADIVSQMRKTPPPNQPATHDSLLYAEFEQYWTQLIGEAMRNTRPLG